MTQEIKDKLEQALADKLTNYIKQRHDQSRCVGYSDGVLAGAQAILDNPEEWRLTVEAPALNAIDNLLSEVKALTEREMMFESQLAKYREALERILQGNCSPTLVAKEALKQEVNND